MKKLQGVLSLDERFDYIKIFVLFTYDLKRVPNLRAGAHYHSAAYSQPSHVSVQGFTQASSTDVRGLTCAIVSGAQNPTCTSISGAHSPTCASITGTCAPLTSVSVAHGPTHVNVAGTHGPTHASNRYSAHTCCACKTISSFPPLPPDCQLRKVKEL